MIIGILSDTHNNLNLTRKAVSIFKDLNVDLIIHAGDLTSPKILELFKEFNCKFVLGNSDLDIDIINQKAANLGFDKITESCDFSVSDKRFLVIHGDNVQVFRDAVSSEKYDYIIKGHAHLFENYISKKTRVINPGSLFGEWEKTIAILDTESDSVKQINLDL